MRRSRHALFVALTSLALAGCGAATRQGASPGSYSARILAFPDDDDPKRTIVTAIVKRADRERFPVALYLDGSGCRSVVHLMHYFDALVQAGYSVVAPEKTGVRVGADGERCSEEFFAHDVREEREEGAREVLSRLAKALPGWSGELMIIAASEGATFAGAIAKDRPALRGLALLGGGGWTQGRELLALQDGRLRRAGAGDAERRGAEAGLRIELESIARSPTPSALWLGATHRRWASYLDYDPLPDLLAVEAPIFLANGARDAMTPVESARAVVAAFGAAGKENLTALEFAELDHRWLDREGRNHFAEVGGALMEWVSRLPERPTGASADR